MGRLRIRLFGGFEVSCGDQLITGFESQKVRALFAYLIMNRDTTHGRDRLAGLLWPEQDDDTARRNLRQVVYNLRTVLAGRDTPAPPVSTTRQSVQFNSETDYWLDVEAFEDAVHQSLSVAGVDPHYLAGAAKLYRGDFLDGFFVDSPAFEHWLLYEQERLRELAIQALRRLVDHYLDNGAYRLGIRYAGRLLEIDPLFEEAHRDLMRLYALSGRRSQAIAQYRKCRNLLRTELGVEPLEETTALYQAMLAEEWPVRSLSSEEAGAPRIPLVGREKAYTRLERSWEAARAGRGWLTLVEGPAGIGKTRLVEDFIRGATARTDTIVVRGRCYDLAPQVAYQPIAEALRRAIAGRAPFAQQGLSNMSLETVTDLTRIVPELRALRPDLPKPDSLAEPETRERLFDVVVEFLKSLVQPAEPGQAVRSLILFLDNLQWADRPSLALLQHLVQRLAREPIWIVAAYGLEELEPNHSWLLVRQQLSRDGAIDRVALDRLSSSAIRQIASSLVDEGHAGDLAEFLDRESAGLPFTVTQLIHYLCDEGVLVPQDDNGWALAGPLPSLAMPTPENLHDLILWRVTQLPTSARRLLTLAAVAGPQFDVQLLQKAEGEHMAVVEAGIDICSKRRLIRPVPRWGVDGVQEGDVNARASAARWRAFEFAHEEIRQVIYHDVNPVRRQVMHRQVATALEKRHAEEAEWACEALAYHYTAAKMWDKALVYVQQAGDKAQASLAGETALHYYDQAVEALDQIGTSDVSEVDRVDWLRQRLQILASRAEIYGHRGAEDKQQADLQRIQDIVEQLNGPDHLSAVVDPSGWVA